MMELWFLKITNLIDVLKFLTVSLLISCEIQGQLKGENPNHNFWPYLKHSEPDHFRMWYMYGELAKKVEEYTYGF